MRRLTGLLLLAALALVACSDDDGTDVQAGDGVATAPTQADLVRRDWRINAVSDASGERLEVDPAYDAVLRFDGEGGFSAKTCNHTGGDVVIAPTTLEWGDGIASTDMACQDEDLMWLETTMGTLYNGTSTWELTDGALTIEGNGTTAELSERPDGFPTEMVQLATNAPDCECEWQFGYTEDPDAGANGGYRYSISWEGREGPGKGYGSASLAVGHDIPHEDMWLDDVEGQLFPFGTLPIGTASAVFETVDGDRIEMHPYELPDGRYVYGEPIDAAKGQVVALDADGNEIDRGRIVPAG